MQTSEERDNALAIAELKGELIAPQERMKTMTAENDSALDRLRADMAQRDKDNLRWQIGLWVAAVVIIGVLIRWPA
ncbi:MAG: hypothetical protein OXE84_13690 [Rhodobacteraceae bacterium]|nr:hypothetical protein [Paracoccaceae bacterium]MCY4195356.1 hypothetical protein [Paracoccaceae bacterium]MCY4327315.1 hypothetical protein [Paracoccaceae bacterium]